MAMKKLLLLLLLLVWAVLSPAQIEENLIAWYPFSGNAVDSSNHGHDGQVFGPVPTADRFGNPNEAYLFDGIDDFISVEDQPSLWLSNQDFSIALWAKFFNSPEADSVSSALLSKRTDYHWQEGYFFQRIGLGNPIVAFAGKLNFIVSGGTDPLINSSSIVEGGEWRHLAVVYSVDEQVGKLFIDGVLEAEGTVLTPQSSIGGDLFIGKDGYTGSFYFKGDMDDVRIYGKKLSPQDILEIMEYNPLSGIWEGNPSPCEINVFPNPAEAGSFSVEKNGCEIETLRVSDPAGKLLWEGRFSNFGGLPFFPGRMVFFQFFDHAGQVIGVKKVIMSGR